MRSQGIISHDTELISLNHTIKCFWTRRMVLAECQKEYIYICIFIYAYIYITTYNMTFYALPHISMILIGWAICKLEINASIQITTFNIWPRIMPILVTLLHDMCSLRWRHNGRDGVSNHQLHYCLLKRLFWRRSKETSKLRVTGLCAGNSPGTGGFPAQRASNAENVSIWWWYHVTDGRISINGKY